MSNHGREKSQDALMSIRTKARLAQDNEALLRFFVSIKGGVGRTICEALRSDSLIYIIVANGKGGVGKSTFIAILADWLRHNKVAVRIIDTDPNQTLQTWVSYCEKERRVVSEDTAKIVLVDTAGTSGSCFTWMKKANLIICPVKANFADLDLVATWFSSLHPNLQDKFVFVPNMVGTATEHRNGIEDLCNAVAEIGKGTVLADCKLRNRDAAYASMLKGLEKNFFAMGRRLHDAQQESAKMVQAVLQQLDKKMQ